MIHARSPLILTCLLLAGTAVAADEQARELLLRMDRAVDALNYEGTFVHIVDGQVETMHVVHRVEDGKVTERLVTLDGPSREIIRDEQEVTCIFADQKSVMVERRKGDSPLRAALPRYSEQLDGYYEFVRLNDGMRLGRDAVSFEIRPRDKFRYGYRLWMDESTGMLLKAQLIDIYHNVAEQLMFVSIRLPETIAADMVEPTIATEDFTWYVQPDAAAVSTRSSAAGWRATSLPPGFRLTTSKVAMMAGADHPTDHLVYSDGIASVSVFIEEPEGSSEQLEGVTRIGGASAFSTMVGDFQVTAMGEVPPITVEMIASSVSVGETAAR